MPPGLGDVRQDVSRETSGAPGLVRTGRIGRPFRFLGYGFQDPGIKFLMSLGDDPSDGSGSLV